MTVADTPQDAETAAREAPGVCGICRTPLNIPGRVWTEDCGGDCLACMADAGDPDCVAALRPASSPGEVTWQPVEAAPWHEEILIGGVDHGVWWQTVYTISHDHWREEFEFTSVEPTWWHPLPSPPALLSTTQTEG